MMSTLSPFCKKASTYQERKTDAEKETGNLYELFAVKYSVEAIKLYNERCNEYCN